MQVHDDAKVAGKDRTSTGMVKEFPKWVGRRTLADMPYRSHPLCIYYFKPAQYEQILSRYNPSGRGMVWENSPLLLGIFWKEMPNDIKRRQRN